MNKDRLSILVVEDEVDLADVLCYHLEREGYHCRRAEDGQRAIAEASRLPPDLIILDRMLPNPLGGRSHTSAQTRQPYSEHPDSHAHGESGGRG